MLCVFLCCRSPEAPNTTHTHSIHHTLRASSTHIQRLNWIGWSQCGRVYSVLYECVCCLWCCHRIVAWHGLLVQQQYIYIYFLSLSFLRFLLFVRMEMVAGAGLQMNLVPFIYSWSQILWFFLLVPMTTENEYSILNNSSDRPLVYYKKINIKQNSMLQSIRERPLKSPSAVFALPVVATMTYLSRREHN